MLLLFFTATAMRPTPDAGDPPFLQMKGDAEAWVDSVIASLSPDERIAQLFMVAAYSNKDQQHVSQISRLVSTYNIGGLIFFQGGPLRQAALTNLYQAMAKTPLLISIDAEWGLAMRLDSTIRFPKQMTLGAVQDDKPVYSMGSEIARECRRLGIHINFAPVVDVNNNPLNPVISNRSFGENKYTVAKKGVAYMRGLQEHGILANAKHFPGHGDTDADSHESLPVVKHSKTEMDTLELYPFRELIENGLGSMMVAHLYIPSYDTTAHLASTLSHSVVTDCLKDGLCFKGLIFTDALNMKGVSAYYDPGVVDVKALLAGNDVLLFSEDVPKAISEIKKAIRKGDITQEEIDIRVRKILSVKYWAGLSHFEPVDMNNLYEDLNRPASRLLSRQIYESSVTILRNENSTLPLAGLDTLRLASLAVGDTAVNAFQQMLGNYAPVDLYQLAKESSPARLDSILKKLEEYNAVILSIHNTSTNPAKNYGITEQAIAVINALSRKTKIIIDVFGNPYCLSRLIGCELSDALVLSYEDAEMPQEISAQVIFGAISARGKLPVTASSYFRLNDGIFTDALSRLKYTLPEEVNIRSEDLARIDSIAGRAIDLGATPGCQVLVAKDGKVIYYKSFGYHTYEKKIPVRNTDLYDIASVTKVSSTALAVMSLYDKGKLDLDKKVYKYLPELKTSNKKDALVREVLSHQAGLQAWIPFWMNTMAEGKLLKKYYRASPENNFSVRVAKNLYLRSDYPDTMWQQVLSSPVKDRGKYVYSDLGMMLMKKVAEKLNHQPLDSFVTKNYYAPLGLSTMGYNPRSRFPLERIIPTEKDMKFRKVLVHGDVHDPAAAMMGGVAGHAGVFSDANDLAILMQMMLQGGEYGGKRYFRKETLSEFTRQQYIENENRRGLIFDKPEVDISKSNPTAKDASSKTFGHSGFTGTCVWVDPEQNLVYVFLSNRVNPDAGNNKLANMNIRTDIHQAIYDAIRNGKK